MLVGPALYYMSKAPGDDVKSYDGSGDWFKIGETGVCNEGGDFTKDAWCTWDKNQLTATIPTDTPSGEYLLRFEHIGKPVEINSPYSMRARRKKKKH